ncbi:hypothetical protein ZOSMA_55G00650 [Zostera marina]|uniref:Uncharacterized protein n=1 Tax=Zostera marina TaxID=29655 RepID=A0A0K9NWH9_ZOSMR|nr:hypothetical protein ZOSMA_55G00650 [Zostera marina]
MEWFGFPKEKYLKPYPKSSTTLCDWAECKKSPNKNCHKDSYQKEKHSKEIQCKP